MGKARDNSRFGNYVPVPPIGTAGHSLVVNSGGDGLEYSLVSGSGGGGGTPSIFASSSKAVSETFTQVGHGFNSGSAIHLSGSVYGLSQANTASKAEVIGMVESVSGNDFTVVYEGRLDYTSHGLGNAGDALYLTSSSLADNVLNSEPSDGISKPVGYVVDANTLLVKIFRGTEIGGTTLIGEQWDTIAGDKTLIAGRNYFINASSVSGSLTFPSANDNDKINIVQGAGELGSFPYVLVGGGVNFRDNVQPDSGSYDVNANFPGRLGWIYNASLNVWILT